MSVPKLFLDTNVILDFLLDSRGSFHDPAVALMREIGAGNAEAVFATSQATDLYYCLRKAVGDRDARSLLRKVFALVGLCATPPEACVDALDMDIPDYEDAVQVATARAARCDWVVTRNLRDYAKSPVPFVDPAGYLALWEARGETRQG